MSVSRSRRQPFRPDQQGRLRDHHGSDRACPGDVCPCRPGRAFRRAAGFASGQPGLCLPASDDQPSEARLAATTGSSEWLWDAAEYWRFDRASSELVQIIFGDRYRAARIVGHIHINGL